MRLLGRSWPPSSSRPASWSTRRVEAERAGFDALNVSDHFQPWWEPGESGQAWVLLGAIGQATERVAARDRRHRAGPSLSPRLVAQFGRRWRSCSPAAASSASARASRSTSRPAGWTGPARGEQVRAHGGGARDHRPAARRRARRPRRPLLPHQGRLPAHARRARAPRSTSRRSAPMPPRWRRASATASGRSPIPRSAPELIDAYRAACDDAASEPGEIILQTGFSWADDDDAALEGARVWKATQPASTSPTTGTTRRRCTRRPSARSPTTSSGSRTSSAPTRAHVERIREIEQPRRDDRLPAERLGRGSARRAAHLRRARAPGAARRVSA